MRALLVNLGPLSERTSLGRSRNNIVLLRYLVICCPMIHVSIAKGMHSSVASLIRVNIRNHLSVAVISLTKSMEQRSFGLKRWLLSGVP